jgi:transcriptional regulator with XRE-family HTH domain
MAESKAVVGARLRAEREARGWSRLTLAGRLRGAAGATMAVALPGAESLSHMIKEWEAGKHGLSARYQYLYGLALDRPAGYLFPGSARAAGNCADDVVAAFTAAWTIENAVLALSGTLGAYMDRRQFVVITGSALADLAPGWTHPWTLVPAGKLSNAAGGGRVDAEIAARNDGNYNRDRVIALAVTADAELAQDHLEPALAAAGSALDGLGLVTSGMTTRLLTDFARRLPAREPAARQFRERLRELPKAS